VAGECSRGGADLFKLDCGDDHSFSCMHLQLQFLVAEERTVRCGRGIDSGTEERRVRRGVTWLKRSQENRLIEFFYLDTGDYHIFLDKY
jgi:hypothetical protein